MTTTASNAMTSSSSSSSESTNTVPTTSSTDDKKKPEPPTSGDDYDPAKTTPTQPQQLRPTPTPEVFGLEVRNEFASECTSLILIVTLCKMAHMHSYVPCIEKVLLAPNNIKRGVEFFEEIGHTIKFSWAAIKPGTAHRGREVVTWGSACVVLSSHV